MVHYFEIGWRYQLCLTWHFWCTYWLHQITWNKVISEINHKKVIFSQMRYSLQISWDLHVLSFQQCLLFICGKASRHSDPTSVVFFLLPPNKHIEAKIQGCNVSSRVSGRTKRANPIWICICFGDTKFAIFPLWYRTSRTNLIWFCIWFGDPK